MAAFRIETKQGNLFRVVFSIFVCLFIGRCTRSSHFIPAPQQQPIKQTHTLLFESINQISACCDVSRRAVDAQGAPIVKHRGWTRKLETCTNALFYFIDDITWKIHDIWNNCLRQIKPVINDVTNKTNVKSIWYSVRVKIIITLCSFKVQVHYESLLQLKKCKHGRCFACVLRCFT